MGNKIKELLIDWLSGMFAWLITGVCVFYISYFETWPVTFFFIVVTIIGALLFAKAVDWLIN
ncbi:hypothetical protein EC847_10475 [Scandinavium goeteborgense]|uniref:Uncharacterized protein n=1 Tax=Scandinavium goeteborgense TaxID=1851514 RepID=A0A4R6EMY4_SCAGO|nr:hypothetical protein EC847_10475 [Scandinavium goeteborgense]